MTISVARMIPFADTWSMHDGDVGAVGCLVMAAGMALVAGVVIALIVRPLRAGAAPAQRDSTSPRDTPREVLDRRLAEGTLDVDEYERRRRLLDDAGALRSDR